MKRELLSLLLILTIAPFCVAQNLLPQPNKKGLWGYVNEKGKYVIKPLYQSAEQFSSGIACVKINDSYGFINTTGQFVITPSFEFAESFNGSYAKCKKDGKYGYIDVSGEAVVDFIFDDIFPSGNKKFQIGQKESDVGVYVITLSDKSSKVKRFDQISSEYEYGFAPVSLNGEIGYIDENGAMRVSPKYLEKLNFSELGIAVSKTNQGYGIIGRDLTNIVPDEYKYVRIIDNGNYIYGDDDVKFGLVSSNGTIIFPSTKYSQTKFLEDVKCFEVKSENKISILDSNGECLIAECDNYSIVGEIVTYSIDGSTLKLNTSNGTRAIVLNNKDIWTPNRASVISYEDPFVLWNDMSGKEHRMTTSGVAVFEDYDKVSHLSKGLYSVEKDGKEALANETGKLLSDWVDGIIPIDEEYLQLVKKVGYGRTHCAIMRGSNGKMMTGWDFAWVYTPLKNGLIPVKLLKGDNLSRTDKKLKMVGDNFYIAEDPSEGLYPITDFKTKKMGIMTESGKILVTPKYDEVGDFHCGMCRVWIAEKGNGFINKSGSLVVPCKYPQVLDFGTIEGVVNYTQVWDNYGYSFYIDKNGKIADPDKVMREAYNSQRQNSWY